MYIYQTLLSKATYTYEPRPGAVSFLGSRWGFSALLKGFTSAVVLL